MIEQAKRGPWYLQLHWQVVLALVLGVAWGVLDPSTPEDPSSAEKFGLVGDLFLRLLKMIIIPLIFTSLVSGIAGLGDAKKVGTMGLKTVIYYTLSTASAIVVGLTVVNVVRPGVGLELGSTSELPDGFSTSGQTLSEFLIRLVPDNVLAVMAQGEVLPVITFAILFGIFLTRTDSDAGRTVHRVVDGVLDIVQRLTLAIVKLAPVGILALLAREVARTGPQIIWDLRYYFVSVGSALLIHALVTLPLILVLVARRNPIRYFGAGLPAIVTAFSTASSSATLPLTMECAERRGKVPRSVGSFVLPLGATVNMDGTALYEAIAALTIAQMYGVELGIGQQAVVLLTALLASVGAAGIPMAGLVMLVVVLEAVGLPLEGIATIIAIDRVLDMMRTATNVWSDLVGSAVVHRLEGGVS